MPSWPVGRPRAIGEAAPWAWSTAPSPWRQPHSSTGHTALHHRLNSGPGLTRAPRGRRPTPAECTMHLGAPVVPDENTMKRGWLKGSCSNSSWGTWSPFPVARKSSRNTLWAERTGSNRGRALPAGTQPSLPPRVWLGPSLRSGKQGCVAARGREVSSPRLRQTEGKPSEDFKLL